MASEQFSLCWDNFHKNMSSGLNALLETEELVDVTLAVEGKYLKAHKMVLSVCSPYFKELFKANPCQHPIVFMKDVSYVAISDLLQFMYQGEVQVSQDNLTTFIKTAEALQIKGLTGDGNGSADTETDSTQDVKSTSSGGRQHADTDYKPTSRPKKQPVPSPISVPPPMLSKAPKRPRLSVSSNDSQSNPPAAAAASITKTEPISLLPETNAAPVQQFKVEPYDQNQSVTIPDDGDDHFGDETLDDTTVDDTEDYSMMEGEETEPQAGTSADGTGEGQGSLESICTLPEASKKRYETVYLNFINWRNLKDADSLSEEIFLDYFQGLSVTYRSSTLWAQYSMLKTTVLLYHQINIENYSKLRKFLKEKAKGYKAKKAGIFTPVEIAKFLQEAPDMIFLATKVALIMAVSGSCRAHELHSITIDDIVDFGTAMMVTVRNPESDFKRQFTITGQYYEYCKQYLSLRPHNAVSNRFFLNYQKGKCTVQNIGVNKFGAMGRQMARFLKLPNVELYSGHSFRRSSFVVKPKLKR